MTPHQFAETATDYKPLIDGLLPMMNGLPIKIAMHASSKDVCTGFRNGKFNLSLLDLPGHRSAEMLFAHELGHILVATREELFMHNLGLNDERSPEACWRECEVISWQLSLYRHFGVVPPGRLLHVSTILFGEGCGNRAAWSAKLQENLNSEAFSFESFTRNWDRVWNILTSSRPKMAA